MQDPQLSFQHRSLILQPRSHSLLLPPNITKLAGGKPPQSVIQVEDSLITLITRSKKQKSHSFSIIIEGFQPEITSKTFADIRGRIEGKYSIVIV